MVNEPSVFEPSKIQCKPFQNASSTNPLVTNVCKVKATLHGPSMSAAKAKINGVLYNQSSSIAFVETSSYWSEPKSSKLLGFSLVIIR